MRSLVFNEVPELKYLPNDDIEKIKNFNFVYECKDVITDENLGNTETIISILSDEASIGRIIINYECDEEAYYTVNIEIEYGGNSVSEYDIYYNIMEKNLGFSAYPYGCFDYEKISESECLEMYQRELKVAKDILNVGCIDNIYLTILENSNKVCTLKDIACILLNIDTADFDISTLGNYTFRVFNASILNTNKSSYKLLQMLDKDKLNGYILVRQDSGMSNYKLFKVQEVYEKANVDSNKLRLLCNLYDKA